MRRRRDISAANARDNYRAAAAVRRSSRLFDRDTLRTDTPSPSAAIDRGIRNRIDRLRTSRRIDTSRRLVVDPTLSTPPRARRTARRTARRGVPYRISRARLFPLPRPPPRISVASSRAFSRWKDERYVNLSFACARIAYVCVVVSVVCRSIHHDAERRGRSWMRSRSRRGGVAEASRARDDEPNESVSACDRSRSARDGTVPT